MTNITVVMQRRDPGRDACPECGARRMISQWDARYYLVVGAARPWIGACTRPIGRMCAECAGRWQERLQEEVDNDHT